MDTAAEVKQEQDALASLLKHPGYKYLEAWMTREMNRALHEMMDERKREDNLKSLAREAKTYQRIMGRVSSAYHQTRKEPI